MDWMATLKMNRLHLHLTDNEGWRLEIGKYPELIRVGANLEDPGYYSKSEIREIISYARARFIEVLPEIDVPGHAYAALKSYPWLCCTGAPEKNAGHQKDLFCAGNAHVIEFLQHILDEVIDLFPFPYIHLGGDEAPKQRWAECELCQEAIRKNGLSGEEELQGVLLRILSEYVGRRGKKAIGWDEALECGIHNDMVVHWWRYRNKGDLPAAEALRLGHQVIASPNSLAYLSFPTDPDNHFKPARTSDLRKVYSAQYIPEGLTEEQRKQVLGAEFAIWTEYLTEQDIDRMLFPRALACAELMWTYPEKRDFSDFLVRVRLEHKRMEQEGIAFGPYFSTF
jgi:hexosaminidase